MPKKDVNLNKISEKDMRADLEMKFADVDARNKALGVRKIVADNTLGRKREAIIRSLMEMIQQLGIDPTDEGAIEELEEQLRFQNPDLAELFRLALERLLDDKQMSSPAEDIGVNGGAQDQVGMMGSNSIGMMPNTDMQEAPTAGIPIPEATNITNKYQQMFGGQPQ